MQLRKNRIVVTVGVLSLIVSLMTMVAMSHATEGTRILIFVGPSTHPPGSHEVAAGGRLLQHCLENVSNLPNVTADIYYEWPKEQAAFDGAHSVVFVGDTFPPQRWPDTPSILAKLDKMMDRGCGIACIHYATGLWGQDVASDGDHPLLGWLGGYFANKTCPHHQGIARVFPAATITPAAPTHPICSGWREFTLHDEPYINNYFGKDDNRLAANVTALATSMLPPEAPNKETVAWCVERADGGRGFAIVMPHFYKNWAMEDLRRFILNGIVWTARVEVPKEGVHTSLTDLTLFAPQSVEYVPPIPKAKKDRETIQSSAARWSLDAPVLDLTRPVSGEPVRLLDPCAVRHGGKWHLFCGSDYFALDELKPGALTPRPVPLPVNGAFVPQVFFFRPKNQWQFIGQVSDTSGRYPKNAPCLSTNSRIDDPQGWSKPIVLDVPPPQDGSDPIKAWNDFYIICDESKAHLLATSAGRLWRSETKLADYPYGWSSPVVALTGDFIYASHTYRRDTAEGVRQYWLNITAVSVDPGTKQRRQYQQSYIADRIEGPWRAELATWEQPLAGPGNIRIKDDLWFGDLVHGEPLRTGNDERMILERDFTGFLFHGHLRDPVTGRIAEKSECVWLLQPEPKKR